METEKKTYQEKKERVKRDVKRYDTIRKVEGFLLYIYRERERERESKREWQLVGVAPRFGVVFQT